MIPQSSLYNGRVMKRQALVFLLAIPLFAQDFGSVEQSARAELAKLNIPGAAIAIVQG